MEKTYALSKSEAADRNEGEKMAKWWEDGLTDKGIWEKAVSETKPLRPVRER